MPLLHWFFPRKIPEKVQRIRLFLGSLGPPWSRPSPSSTFTSKYVNNEVDDTSAANPPLRGNLIYILSVCDAGPPGPHDKKEIDAEKRAEWSGGGELYAGLCKNVGARLREKFSQPRLAMPGWCLTKQSLCLGTTLYFTRPR